MISPQQYAVFIVYKYIYIYWREMLIHFLQFIVSYDTDLIWKWISIISFRFCSFLQQFNSLTWYRNNTTIPLPPGSWLCLDWIGFVKQRHTSFRAYWLSYTSKCACFCFSCCVFKVILQFQQSTYERVFGKMCVCVCELSLQPFW